MSGHLIGCVGNLDDPGLAASHKLALVAFADSADDRTHIAFPGYAGVQKWAGCSRSRASELIRDLVALGYLEQYKKAHRGQRAEYIVFPRGCCDLHRTPAEEPDIDVQALAASAGVTVDQARLMLAAMAPGAAVEPHDVHPAPEAASSTEKGFEPSNPMSGNESGASNPNPHDVPEPVENPVENPASEGERVQKGFDASDPFTPSTKPPFPPGTATGPTVDTSVPGCCPRHPDGHPNCRHCGTTPRQQADRERRAKAAARRAQILADQAARRRAEAAAANRPPDPAAAQGRAAAKAAARHTTTASGGTR